MEGEKRKKNYYNPGYSNLDTHPSTNAVERGLTVLSELNMLLSLWYSDYAERFFFNLLDEKWYQKEKKISNNVWLGKEKTKELEKYENEIYYLLWWSDKHHFPYINCRGLLDEDNAVTRTDNFVDVNVFSSVTSPRVLSYRCVLHYFLTMPMCFNFNLAFGLKSQVGGIKTVTV